MLLPVSKPLFWSPDKRRLSLGVKQLQPDVWETFFEQHHVGDVLHAKCCALPTSAPSWSLPTESKASCPTPEVSKQKGIPFTSNRARSITSKTTRTTKMRRRFATAF